MLLAGCAGGRRAQEFQRLQSQVGLLDQRVGQLERMGQFPGPELGIAVVAPAYGADTGSGGYTATEAATTKPAPARSSSSGQSMRGSTHDIQQALKNAGFYQGAIDGKMGPITREAIKEFQRLHGLTDDGVAGKQTWAKLRPYLDGSGGDGSPESLK